jgi:hypothetical protein
MSAAYAHADRHCEARSAEAIQELEYAALDCFVASAFALRALADSNPP